MSTSNTYNTAGALLRSRTQPDPLWLLPQSQMRQYYDEAFSYSRGGLIKEKYFTQDGESRRERYDYDPTARLTFRRDLTWAGADARDPYQYGYDAVGNRVSSRTNKRLNYFHTPGTDRDRAHGEEY